jgi:hypothetical protein
MLGGMHISWVGLLGVSVLALCACDDQGCDDKVKIALEVHVTAPVGVTISKVTAELEREEDCGSFRDRSTDERVWTCTEQGGGQYVLRVYSGDEELHQETKRVEADECHVKELETVFVTVEAPAP